MKHRFEYISLEIEFRRDPTTGVSNAIIVNPINGLNNKHMFGNYFGCSWTKIEVFTRFQPAIYTFFHGIRICSLKLLKLSGKQRPTDVAIQNNIFDDPFSGLVLAQNNNDDYYVFLLEFGLGWQRRCIHRPPKRVETNISHLKGFKGIT